MNTTTKPSDSGPPPAVLKFLQLKARATSAHGACQRLTETANFMRLRLKTLEGMSNPNDKDVKQMGTLRAAIQACAAERHRLQESLEGDQLATLEQTLMDAGFRYELEAL